MMPLSRRMTRTPLVTAIALASLSVATTASADISSAELEARLEALENRVAEAEQRAAAAEQRAQRAKAALEALDDSDLEKRLADVEAHAEGDLGLSLNAYARSGLLLDSHGKSAPGGPYLTPAGSTGGAVGRLGNEPDTYVETTLNYKQRFDNGARSHYRMMLADSVTTSND